MSTNPVDSILTQSMANRNVAGTMIGIEPQIQIKKKKNLTIATRTATSTTSLSTIKLASKSFPPLSRSKSNEANFNLARALRKLC